MKKIIFVAQTLNRGGAERVLSLLSQEFSKRGYEVKIILFDNKIQYEYGGEIINIETPASPNYFVKLLRIYQRIQRLKVIFSKEKADYIFSFMESCNFASVLTGTDVIISIRNNPNKKHNWYQKFLIKFLYKFHNVKKIVAVSGEIEKILNKDYKLTNTTTILNPIIIDNNYEIKEDLSKYKPYIVSVGRLNKQKNFEMLINAYNQTNTKQKAKLLIVGEGNERKNLELLIDKLNLQDKVILIGQKENVKDYYLQSDIYVLSSSFEGFPNVLVEALSNKCACIATNCPTGPKEIIKNYENGILVENENKEILTDAIDELYNDEKLKETFRSNSDKSIEHLNIEKIANKWVKL